MKTLSPQNLLKHSSDKAAGIQSGVIAGFNFYQESVCGYSSCAYTLAHYHCQGCGYATSEVPHALVHKDSCSGMARGSFSCVPRYQPPGSCQVSEQSELCPPYDVGSESTGTMSGTSVPSLSPQVGNSGGHFYYRGGMAVPQQSPVFNPLLSSQSQPLYSGVYGSQTGYTNQNSFSQSGFNGYGHVEPPPWLASSGPLALDSGRRSKGVNASCSSQGLPHACCGGRLGPLDSIGLCSPLSSDMYKSPSCQPKTSVNVDSQNWLCNPGMMGYGNQSNQNIQHGGYKCSDPFPPSCAMSQMNMSLSDPGEPKDSCFDPGKQPGEGMKTSCTEVNKGDEAAMMFEDAFYSLRPQALLRCGLDPCDVMDSCLQPLFYPPLGVEDEDKDSHQGSSSDIVVEETEEEEELTESEISIEELKCSELRCLVCDVSAPTQVSDMTRFVHMRDDSPVTSGSHVPVATKLAQVVASDFPPLLQIHDDFICRCCLNLIDTVDCLETKLATAKQDLIQLFKCRMVLPEKECPLREEVTVGVDNDRTGVDSDKVIVGIDSDKITECIASDKITDCIDSDKITECIDSDKITECIDSDNTFVGVDSDKTCIDKGNESSKDLEVENTKKESCDESLHEDSFSDGDEDKEFDIEESSGGKVKDILQNCKSYSFYCDRCGRGFMFRSGLDNHLLGHAGEFRYQCDVCGRRFVQRHALADHLRRHNGTFRHTCPTCSKGFLYASALRVHQRTHTGERPFVCQHCGHTFASASNLTAHVRACSGERPFACDRCERRFATAPQLHAHGTATHSNDSKHNCEVCNKGFSKLSDLRAHSRSHSGEKPHRCSTCGKSYVSVGNLNQHAKMHSSDRPFHCEVCGQGFLRRSILARHSSRHIGTRPFTCERCGKTFTSDHDLHAHARWHAGTLKRYTCPVCGKSVAHGLKVHMRTHNGLKPYVCTHCAAAFSVKSTLDKHVKVKHQQIT